MAQLPVSEMQEEGNPSGLAKPFASFLRGVR